MTEEASATDAAEQLAELVRVEGGRIVAVLTRVLGDLRLAEDAVQDATVTALEVWPRTGVPADPTAWLYVAARRRATDVIRREANRSGKEQGATERQLLRRPGRPPESAIRDDQLRLLFTCCHPALALEAQVALALRTLCGLSTADVARALLVPDATMAKRLVRAKQKIAQARIPYRIPDEAELPSRLSGVLAVVHLVYTAGHGAAGEQLVRTDLCEEAIRLARLLRSLLPDQPGPAALLALLLLTDARRPARVDLDGDIVLLADQDRSRWDRAAIELGLSELRWSLERTGGLADPYQLQAAIAACHATAPSYAATDWPEIVRLYDLLLEVHPSAVVVVNRAVAVLEAQGPAVALAELEGVALPSRGHSWYVVRGEALARLGRRDEAAAALDRASTSAPSEPERRHLARRAGTLSGKEERCPSPPA